MSADQSRGRRRPSREYYAERHDFSSTSASRRPHEPNDSIEEEPQHKVPKRETGLREERENTGDNNGGDRNRNSVHAVRSHGDDNSGRQDRRRNRPGFDLVCSRPAGLTSKMGKNGKSVVLQANYFNILNTPTWQINQYHVEFEPPIEMRRLRAGILSEHKKLFGGFIYDGLKMFTSKRLKEDLTVLNVTSRQGNAFVITLKFVGVISMTETQSLQVLNLILRRSMGGLKLQQIGRNFFDSHARIDIREFRLQLWPGYETSIRQHENGIMMCAEIAHKVMRTETVYDILTRCIQTARDYREDFRRQVLGLTVLTDYNNKTYSISDVDFTKTPSNTFTCKDKEISFIDYYNEKYNIRIRYPKQPLLVSKAKEKSIRGGVSDIIILIPELCRATGLTDSMRTNFQLMRALSDHTRMNPDRRIERLLTFNQRLQNTPESVNVLKDWSMTLDKKLVQLNGRILEVQKIKFGNDKRVLAGDQVDWTREFRNNSLFSVPSRGLHRWAVISTHRSVRDLKNFVDALIRTADGMAFKISHPREFLLHDDRNHSFMQAMDECAKDDPQLILCLVPNNNAERYSSIKRKGCLERSIPTQVITQKTAGNQRGLMSVATKVAIQINCKLGYTPWSVRVPLNGLMTIGYDVAKSTRDRSKAYGALVATMDIETNATFYSTVAECNAHDVIANHLWPMMTKALRQYLREHSVLPSRILFYRDGVSEGSLAQLYEQELKDIIEKLQAEYARAGADKPKFAYIVVSKRINTRFFQGGRNPPPGAIVDDVVTLPERYDFFLVSQSVRQGTVAPTYYNVIDSTIQLSPDHIQLLTYKLTHLYYNWSGTTRVPAVCQYAKKLATLVATSLYQPPNSMEKKLYYL